MAAATESWRPKRTASLRLQNAFDWTVILQQIGLGLVVGYFKAFATDGGIYNSISIRVYVKKHTLKNH
jgi:hypothetical protein